MPGPQQCHARAGGDTQSMGAYIVGRKDYNVRNSIAAYLNA